MPVILTARLKLRGVEASDFDRLVAHWSHPETIRFIGGSPRPPEQVWARNVLGSRALWPLLGYGYWLAEDRKSGEYVGEIGFADFHRETEPRFWGIPECGWVISPDRFGQGYASEAVTAIHDWFDHECSEGKSVCIIDDDNHASIRIAAKVGYQKAGSVRMNGQEIGYFERRRGAGKL